jgi:hypothetical protein
MGIERQHESEKVTGDKFESAVDRAAAGGPGRNPGQSEPEEEGEEIEREEDADTEVEDDDE